MANLCITLRSSSWVKTPSCISERDERRHELPMSATAAYGRVFGVFPGVVHCAFMRPLPQVPGAACGASSARCAAPARARRRCASAGARRPCRPTTSGSKVPAHGERGALVVCSVFNRVHGVFKIAQGVRGVRRDCHEEVVSQRQLSPRAALRECTVFAAAQVSRTPGGSTARW